MREGLNLTLPFCLRLAKSATLELGITWTKWVSTSLLKLLRMVWSVRFWTIQKPIL